MFELEISPDGAFSCEDVPPGKYQLSAAFAVDADKVQTAQVSWLMLNRREVVVSPLTEAEGQTLDLGTLKVTPPTPAPAPVAP
jgi:hypothetical protein